MITADIRFPKIFGLKAVFKGFLILLMALAFCEVILRLVFHEGLTFSFTDGGPIAAKFKANYVYNRFGSRGPDGGIGPSGHKIKIIVVGDSITFGQGLRNEEDLYTSKLLKLLKGDSEGGFEMFVLAKPGHEIYHHVEKLDRHGLEIKPDVIVYQWFVNDMELAKSRRQRQRWAIWRKAFFHDFFYRHSYVWFFIDNRLTNLLFLIEDRLGISYPSYILRDYGSSSTVQWRNFESLFREWCDKATALSPRVMIMLYPNLLQLPVPEYPFRAIHERIKRIAGEYDIKTVDLIEYLGDLSDLKLARANRFDVHPSAMMHERMAQVLSRQIKDTWPDLFAKER